jgi:dTDP-4-amino-4,6-dideoxygalactose transaminase
MNIPFNKPYITGKELENISRAHENGMLSGDGPFTKKCHKWLEQNLGVEKALLTHSCTAALEMAAILINLQPGDEVIMPSFTFVSTANAFVLRGAIPVFVDIRSDNQNINELLIEKAITVKTKAIVVVHYAGISCEMDTIMKIANENNLIVIEDAAQAIMSKYKGKPLGSIGHLGCLSFHETKNVISGEGGALLINDNKFNDRAEIIREKGTNRSIFLRGQVDKYTWCDIGSSFLPGEIIAAFLWAQLNNADEITKKRLIIWNYYNENLNNPLIEKPIITKESSHNAHMFYIKLNKNINRDSFLSQLKLAGVIAVFHYVPLHTSPCGIEFGRTASEMSNTVNTSDALIRLPLWIGVDYIKVVKIVNETLNSLS